MFLLCWDDRVVDGILGVISIFKANCHQPQALVVRTESSVNQLCDNKKDQVFPVAKGVCGKFDNTLLRHSLHVHVLLFMNSAFLQNYLTHPLLLSGICWNVDTGYCLLFQKTQCNT